jgi:molecular chaperone GrpE
MTDTTTRGPQPEPAEDESLGNAPEMAAPAPETAAPAGDPVTALTQEVAELKDKLLRTLAEMENLRRRTEREVADARVYGIAAFARDVVGVADNMRRALEAVGSDVRESADAQVKALIEGVDLTERELLKSLEKHGITKIDPQGEKFDPHLHQAMFEVPDPERPAGTVVQVVQPGYKIGERVLRPALVGVAKGGPKPGAEQPANDNPSASA